MKLAAIDIGSNAIRLQVTTAIHTKGQMTFKKLEYVRFPLRLGQDVFNDGEIGKEKKAKFKKLMRAFKLLIDLYEVDDYMACATSALREAENGAAIVKEVEKDCELKITVIDGEKEAAIINDAIHMFIKKGRIYLHIDVGGGSTELTLINKGKKIKSASFKIGSVRRLGHHDTPKMWSKMKKWILDSTQDIKDPITAIGTGGNINKLFELSGKLEGQRLTLNLLKQVQRQVSSLTMEERINELQLNPDRADVIIPASDIYISVMEWAKASGIVVPAVGLKDGIMQLLYQKNLKKGNIIIT